MSNQENSKSESARVRGKVIEAYKTEFGEEILMLEEGAFIYLYKGSKGQLFFSQEDLKKILLGQPQRSKALLESWKNGYPPK